MDRHHETRDGSQLTRNLDGLCFDSSNETLLTMQELWLAASPTNLSMDAMAVDWLPGNLFKIFRPSSSTTNVAAALVVSAFFFCLGAALVFFSFFFCVDILLAGGLYHSL